MIELDLTGRSALITGASGELGRVMARTLARAGADVAVHYHRARGRADAVVDELRDMGRRSLAVGGDVTREEDVARMGEQVRSALGDPDILICNAVIQYAWKPLLEQPLADYESQYASCVRQAVLMSQQFAPAMVKAGRGRIVGINTECAMQCHETQSAYAAAKRGMDGIFRVLARELGPSGVTVNQVAPGWTASERDGGGEPEGAAAYAAEVPLRRRGRDQEIANVVLFLASDLASFTTGAHIPVCGGNVMPAI